MESDEENLNQKQAKKWDWKFIIEILGITIAIIGLFFTGYSLQLSYLDAKDAREDEAKSRDYISYKSLSDSYQKILEATINHPKLDSNATCFNAPCPQESLNEEEKKKQILLYCMILNHFEQAYRLIYKNERLRDEFWPGWEIYICSYLKDDNFKKLWDGFGSTWSKEFQDYINKRMGDRKCKNCNCLAQNR